MYFAYSLVLGTALVLAAPWWLLQMMRHSKYRAGLWQRLGFLPAHLRNVTQPVIWVHAVSVGEVLAVGTLVRRLRECLPSHRIVVSTTTATGNQLARDRFGAENVFFFPLDFGFAIRPYMNALRPEMVVLAETEFWPNFLRGAARAGAKIAVVNARISDRSFPRYRGARRLLCRVLMPVAAFLAQSEEDGRRLKEIGAKSENVQVSGNLKFEVNALSELAIVGELRRALEKAGPVVVCGSTVEGEEPVVLAAFQEVLREFPSAVLLLAPRHKERFDAVADILRTSSLTTLRRSQWTGEQVIPGSVLLLDSLGELGAVYALADVAFVGGSLVPRGGHNILEPAQHAVPILVGPHTENFRDIINIFLRAKAVEVVTPETLGQRIAELLRNDTARKNLGERAQQVVRSQSGATERTLRVLAEILAGAR